MEPEPEGPDQDALAENEGDLHFLVAKQLLLPKSVGVGTDAAHASSQYEEYEEEKKGVDKAVGDDEEASDDDNFSCHSASAPNKVTVGI